MLFFIQIKFRQADFAEQVAGESIICKLQPLQTLFLLAVVVIGCAAI
jgi:hypothetical protein